MDFPSALEIIKQYHFFLLSGPLLIGVGVGGWWRLSTAWRRGIPLASNRAMLFGSLVALLIGVSHLIGTYSSVANALRFHIDPMQISELRIERLAGESEPALKPDLIFTDRDEITKGFHLLSSAQSRMRNHEGFSDGYRLQLKFAGASSYSDLYISVYRKSGSSTPVAVVIPHIGSAHTGTIYHGGEYSCPAFLEWVTRVIDPLFR